MSTTIKTAKPSWRASVEWERRFFPRPVQVTSAASSDVAAAELEKQPSHEPTMVFEPVWHCFVDAVPPGGERIRFRVNHRQGRSITIIDPRDRAAGTRGTTGLWGTLPPPRMFKPRPLTLREFTAELARLIGANRATDVIDEMTKKFEPFSDNCQIDTAMPCG
jgi:hypothetical protein